MESKEKYYDSEITNAIKETAFEAFEEDNF